MREPIRDKNRWEHIVKWIVPSLMSYEMTSSLFAGRQVALLFETVDWDKWSKQNA